MKIPFAAALALFLLSSTLAASVRAEDVARNVSKEQAEHARALFERGVEAQRVGDWEKAYEALQQSYNLRRSFDTAANLGQVEFKLERYAAAAEHLSYWLRQYPTSEKPELYDAIHALFEKARLFVGALIVEVDEPGATVFVNDERVGTSPLEHELFIEEGTHEVRAEFEGKVVSTEFEAKNGETSELKLKFADRFSAPASRLDEGDPTFREPAPGVEPSRTKRNWTPAWILGGATVATLGTSMVFRGLAGSTSKKADETAEGVPSGACVDSGIAACSELERQERRLKTQAGVSNATLIASGILGAATIGYVIFARAERPGNSTVTARANLGPSGGSVFLIGRF